MATGRELEWAGCFNVRDLGGFPTRDERRTRRNSIVRADDLDRLTSEGWGALLDHGVRTVIDLRNDDEVTADVGTRPIDVETVRVPLDDLNDLDLWRHIRDNELDGSPLYFQVFLERKPERCAAAIKAIAHSQDGGVVFHCGRGRDRTGLVAMLLLALVGVSAAEIVADYELSTDRVRRLDAALGEPDQGSEIADILRRKNTSAAAAILDLIATGDIEKRLRAGGLTPADVQALRHRFLSMAH